MNPNTSGLQDHAPGRALGTALSLTLAAVLLACAGGQVDDTSADASATAALSTATVAGDPADTAAIPGTTDSADSTDPTDPTDAGTSTGPADPATSGDMSTGGVEPPAPCTFDPDVPVACDAIARLIVSGVGLSEAHVARRHLRLEDAAGVVLGPEFRACLRVMDAQCEDAGVAIDPAPGRSITSLLIRPQADAAANDALIAATLAFIDGRPEGELIGVFRWGGAVTQISTPTADRLRLHHLVERGLQPLDGEALALSDAVAAIAGPLVAVREQSHLSLRQLVVVAPGHPPVDAGTLQFDGDAAHVRVDLVAANEVDAALVDASARLDAALTAGEMLLRHCALSSAPALTLRVAGDGPTLALPSLHVPGAEDLQGPLSCHPADTGLTPALPGVFDLDFSPDEWVDYEANVADLSKEPFYGSLRTDLNVPGLRARVKLKLHGQGSLDCERKSLAVNLTDDVARQWLQGSGTDQFFLVSMCKDDRYITQHTANQMMARLGLFAPRFRMVELVIGGVSQGVYLLLEKPSTLLRRDSSRPRVIVRRASDIEGKAPEVHYATDDDLEQGLATYEAFLGQAESLKGDARIAWLDASLDLDQYLRWIALMTLLESGDYIDEVFFVSTEATGADAAARDFFTISTWDQDDIFSSCHKDGINAIVDPHGLLTCAESRLDHAIFSEPEIYARFAEILGQTLEVIDQPTFDAATHVSEEEVIAVLASEDARAAMIELLDDNPDAVDYDVAVEEVLARGEELRKLFAKRRALVSELLGAYGG